MKPDATLLAFDFGTRRIGVAIANTVTRSAQPLTTVAEATPAATLDAIATLIDAWQPAQLVVGLPVHADGTAHAMTAHVRRFAERLETRFRLPVALVDERYTTQIAEQSLRDRGRRGADVRAQRDAAAAALILQAFLDDDDGA
jgi:putative pre-16S rRNA nuclease